MHNIIQKQHQNTQEINFVVKPRDEKKKMT